MIKERLILGSPSPPRSELSGVMRVSIRLVSARNGRFVIRLSTGEEVKGMEGDDISISHRLDMFSSEGEVSGPYTGVKPGE